MPSMIILIAGLLIFFGVHLVPSFPGLRRQLATRWSEKIYLIGYAILAAGGLLLITYGKANAPFTPLYVPPAWGWPVAWVLMWFSLTLLLAAYLPTNLKRWARALL